METISGTLIGGVDFEGKTHKAFTMRPLLVRDTLETLEAVKEKPALYVEMVFMARQLVSLGEIPKEKITGELLLDMHDQDIAVIEAARIDLQKKILGGDTPAAVSENSAT